MEAWLARTTPNQLLIDSSFSGKMANPTAHVRVTIRTRSKSIIWVKKIRLVLIPKPELRHSSGSGLRSQWIHRMLSLWLCLRSIWNTWPWLKDHLDGILLMLWKPWVNAQITTWFRCHGEKWQGARLHDHDWMSSVCNPDWDGRQYGLSQKDAIQMSQLKITCSGLHADVTLSSSASMKLHQRLHAQ